MRGTAFMVQLRGGFVFIALVSLLLAGCGVNRDAGDDTTPTAANAAADADVKSGCWRATDRGASEEEGADTDVAHQQWSKEPEMVIDTAKVYKATLATSAGDVEVTFFPSEAPKTVNNFVCLARAGYFDNTPFHRIVAGFVIQGGDPTGTGRGGPGYRFADEPVTRSYTKGILAMANAGPNTNGSQFFICVADVGLPPNYTIFGEVTGGMDVVDTLAKTPTKVGSSGEKSTPINPVTLNKVTITEAAQ